MKTKILLPLLALIMLFASCAKDPVTGPAGKDGNANVKVYDFPVFSGNWIGSTNPYYHYNAIPVSQSMGGAVMVYNVQGTKYIALPLIVSSTQSMQFIYDSNTILEIDLVGMSVPSQTLSFRCVIISPSRMKEHPEVNYSNYAEVKKTFNLKD